MPKTIAIINILMDTKDEMIKKMLVEIMIFIKELL